MKKVILLLLAVIMTAACSNDEKNPVVTGYWSTEDTTSFITFYDNNTAHVKNADIDMTGEVSKKEIDGTQYLVITFWQKPIIRAYFNISPATTNYQTKEITVKECYLIGGDVTEKKFTRTYYQRFEL